jgi:uncharacterized membrane protein
VGAAPGGSDHLSMTHVAPRPEVEQPHSTSSPLRWFGVLVLAAVVGMAATIIQIVERISLAENSGAELLCDINGTFSCGNVLTSWQSSVFGPIPNSAIGLSVFALTLGLAGAGLLGSLVSKSAWAVATFLAGFMAVFTIWFLAQTAFVIGAVCLYCLVIAVMVLLLNLAWWRIGHMLGHLSGNRALDAADWVVRGNTDLLAWVGLAVIVAAMMVAGLAF